MKFGKVDNPENIDFTLPPDHPETARVLKEKGDPMQKSEVFIGCAKWNRSDLKGFYPRGTKDELEYYATQFNSIELNATFYQPYGPEQYKTWAGKTPENFKFFPKVNQNVSHFKRLNGTEEMAAEYARNAKALQKKLGMMFLQLRDDFKPRNMDRIENFLSSWPKEVPLAVEVRARDWFEEPEATEIFNMLEAYDATNIIVDTAGRRDMLHMRLTTPYAFIRYVGANTDSDYTRLNDWLDRLEPWMEQGIRGIYFFIHQNVEKASPLLATHFIEGFNKRFGYDLKLPDHSQKKEIPNLLNEPQEGYAPKREKLISKDRLMKSLQALPEEFSIEQLVDRLLLISKVERGLKDITNGDTFSTEEARSQLAKWLK